MISARSFCSVLLFPLLLGNTDYCLSVFWKSAHDRIHLWYGTCSHLFVFHIKHFLSPPDMYAEEKIVDVCFCSFTLHRGKNEKKRAHYVTAYCKKQMVWRYRTAHRWYHSSFFSAFQNIRYSCVALPVNIVKPRSVLICLLQLSKSQFIEKLPGLHFTHVDYGTSWSWAQLGNYVTNGSVIKKLYQIGPLSNISEIFIT